MREERRPEHRGWDRLTRLCEGRSILQKAGSVVCVSVPCDAHESREHPEGVQGRCSPNGSGCVGRTDRARIPAARGRRPPTRVLTAERPVESTRRVRLEDAWSASLGSLATTGGEPEFRVIGRGQRQTRHHERA